MGFSKTELPPEDACLSGRDAPLVVNPAHHVSGAATVAPFPEHLETAMFALGCFWGAERLFWSVPGVYSTQVGYAGGVTPNPTYQEVCSGQTRHAEVVRVQFDPSQVSYAALLKTFWEAHDPTQGMRQQNDVGTQYRSAIYTYSEAQHTQAQQSRAAFEARLKENGLGPVTTEVEAAGSFYYAEDEHQQYLSKNPAGYCGLKGTGVACPI